MNRPLVFISYSRAANTSRPGYAAVLEAIERQLGRDFEVFRDTRSIPPGDAWYDAIDPLLNRCRAAVTLLCPEALESDWVYYECTVLARRRRLEAGLKLVPVTVAMAGLELARSRFEPMRLSEYGPIEAEGSPEAVAAAVAAAIGPASALSRPPSVESWLDTMATVLNVVDAATFHRLGGSTAAERARDASVARRAFAERLLDCTQEQIRKRCSALESVLAHERSGCRQRIAQLVAPLWVNSAFVAELAPTHDPSSPGGRVWVRLSRLQAGVDHVRRTWLTEEHHRLVEGPPANNDDAKAFRELTIILAQALDLEDMLPSDYVDRVEDPEVTAAFDAELRFHTRDGATPFVLILAPGYAMRLPLLAKISRQFPRLSLLILGRDEDHIKDARDTDDPVLEPLMTPSEETAGLDWARRLTKLLTRRVAEQARRGER